MDAVLLDTDVFSFFFKPDSRCDLYSSDIRNRQLCLAFQTVAELRMWAIVRNWGDQRRDRLTQVLRHYVILPYDTEMADAWAEITAHRRLEGQPIACGDCWIAAAALRHNLPFLTHNRKHFAEIPGLQLISHAPE